VPPIHPTNEARRFFIDVMIEQRELARDPFAALFDGPPPGVRHYAQCHYPAGSLLSS
jgi:hypothetical protein